MRFLRAPIFLLTALLTSQANGQDPGTGSWQPSGHVTLKFQPAGDAKAYRTDLSAVAAEAKALWLVSDETTSVERLTATADGIYSAQESTDLSEFFTLPAKKEIDLEGVSRQGSYLWLAGSHCLARDKDDLTIKEKPSNRYFLARLPVKVGAENLPALTRKADFHGSFRPARLAGDGRADELTTALAADPFIAPFLHIPSKDNGLDIEGLAVLGSSDDDAVVYLGLRGPVLREYAAIIAVRLTPDAKDPGLLHLKPVAGRSYTVYFLHLDGLGVRDLTADGAGNLLILTGPTMGLDGPAGLYRWQPPVLEGNPGGPANKIDPGTSSALRKLGVLPSVAGGDHEEGICVYTDGSGGKKVLVVYDSPVATREVDEHGKANATDVRADVFTLP